MVLVQLASYTQNSKIGPYPPAIHKNKLKMNNRPSIKATTIKVFEENIAVNFQVLGLGKAFSHNIKSKRVKTKSR